MSPSLAKAVVGLTLLSLTSPSLAQVAGQSLGLTGSTGAGTAGAPAIGGQNVLPGGPGMAAPGQGPTPAQLAQISAEAQALSSIESSVAASAQTQIPLFLLNTDHMPVVANVVAAPNADTTTFAIGCATGLPPALCGLPANPSMQVEHISASIVRASVTVTQGDNISLSWACTLTTAGSGPPIPSAVKGWGNPAANAAVCTTSIGVGGGQPPPPSPTGTITLTGTDLGFAFLKVAVTSGSEKLAATASANGTAASTGASTAAATGSSTTSSMAAGMTGMAGNATAKANSTTTGGAGMIGGSGLGLSALSAVFLGSLLYLL